MDNLKEQIASFQGILEKLRKQVAAMAPGQREEMELAATVLHKSRAAAGAPVPLPMPEMPQRRGGAA